MINMSSREFNQKISHAQRVAQHEPVLITNRGNPAFVLLSHAEYQRLTQKKQTALEVLTPSNIEVADIDFPLPPRQTLQRKEVELE